jgi:protein SCO1
MTALKLLRYGAWLSVVALAAIVAYVLLTPEPKQAGGGRIGGPFKVAMANGGVLDSATLSGRPYALFFGFTQCPDVCPGTLSDMTSLMDTLDKGPHGEAAKGLRMYFITVDPERDTDKVLVDYLGSFDGRVVGLVPKLEELPALTKQFAAFYAKVPTSSGYTMNHTAAVYLFDRKGSFVGTIDMQEARDNQLAKLQRLLTR